MRPGRRTVAVTAASAALLLALTPPQAVAEPAVSPPPQSKLDKLTKQAAQLSKAYRGQLRGLEDVRDQAKKATRRVAALERRLAATRREVTEYARTAYMGGTLDSLQIFGIGGDPRAALAHAATVSHLADERAQRLRQVEGLLAEAKKARKAAEQKIDELEKEIKELRSKRQEIEKLLAKYGFQQPTGANGLTPRMVTVRNSVLANFPMPYGYGCLRPGDPGDHGKGRACDFMLSRGGQMPSQVDLERGDALAQWAIENGPRIGIMYIIWKQRYYDVRTGAGWRQMSDRGSITANHWDHVHISVF